jgi:hypothetical protein
VSAFELALLVALTWAELPILSAYLYSKLAGLSLRIAVFSGFAESHIDGSHMRSYSFAALAPALYFNIYYTLLPVFVAPEIVVRFRLLQSLLVPMSFLGSLLARARIISRGAPDLLMRLLDVPRRSQRPTAFAASALLPFILSLVYIVAIGFFVEPLHAAEIACTVLYCSLIYHRAQLYSLITLQLGPVMRARVALGGILLIILSFLPIATVDDPTVTLLYGLLVIVELTLLVASAFLLGREQSEARA